MQVFTGNLSRDSKLTEYTRPDGTTGIKYNNAIGMNSGLKDRNDEKIATFLNFTLWGERAQHFAEKFQKGDRVHFAGDLVPNSFEKDGVKYNGVELRVGGMLDENQARRIKNQVFEAVHGAGDGEQIVEQGGNEYDMEM
ncbi:hypothetical protein FACS189425_03380 [Clostridia bacterium]|nr:hypothetical protein FACS189425_03380 [Clostridia bacterium]